MDRFLVAALIAAAFAWPARADYDPAQEARDAAAKKAAQQEQARRQAQADAMRGQANLKMMRAYLGKEAEGKSDADVKRLYEARTAAYSQRQPQPSSAAR